MLDHTIATSAKYRFIQLASFLRGKEAIQLSTGRLSMIPKECTSTTFSLSLFLASLEGEKKRVLIED
jgi:hypothetical protein